MSEYSLSYGHGSISLKIPDSNLESFITPQQKTKSISIDECLDGTKISAWIADNFSGKDVVILSEDSTRNTPTHELITRLIPQFALAKSTIIILATGTHASDSPDNLALKKSYEEVIEGHGIANVVVHNHDCESDSFALYGITRRGTSVYINSLIDRAEIVLGFSDMKSHYFAGYSNPVKLFFPGIAHYDSVEKNHSLALKSESRSGFHVLHPDPDKRNNPLAEDMVEAYNMIAKGKLVFALCLVSFHREISWFGFGELPSTAGECMAAVDESSQFEVKKADKIIVSPGGFPDDESLYIAQRALELTKSAVKEGGEILFLADCENGIGPERTFKNFYDRLTVPLDEILAYKEKDYKLYTHKPYKFAQLLSTLSKFSMLTSLDADTTGKIHLTKIDDPQKIVDEWVKAGAKISIFDGANKLAVYTP